MQLFKDSNKFSELSNFLDKNQVADKLFDTVGLFIKPKTFKPFKNIKSKGYSIQDIFLTLLILPFASITSVNGIYKSNLVEFIKAKKDVFYDLKNNPNMDWRKLLYIFVKLAFRIINKRSEDNDDKNPKCYIVDDTSSEKTGHKIENVGFIHDHTSNDWILGFKMLTLGFWDGKSFWGLDFTLQKEKISAKRKKFRSLLKKMKTEMFRKKRSHKSEGYKREKEMLNTKIFNALSMIKRAVKNGFIANYVLADSWFISENFIKEIRKIRKGIIHVIGMVRQDKRMYNVAGKMFTSKQIIAKYKCKAKTSRKLRMQYVPLVCEYKGVKVKLFLTKQGFGKNQKWKIILSTDLSLSFMQMMKIYHIRWAIEVYFKECKQYLELGKSQSNDFDAQISDITIVMVRSIILTLIMRFNNYETTGELFRESQKELITRTLSVRIWELVLELFNELLELIDMDYEEILTKTMQDENVEKKFTILLKALKSAA